MKTFFTADTHHGHKKIVIMAKRPFADIDEHDHQIIKNWNREVGRNDEVYHLGDFAFCCNIGRTIEILKQLNGKIYLIRGNHDQNADKVQRISQTTLEEGFPSFEWIEDYKYIRVPDADNPNGKGYQGIVLCHYPFVTWYKAHKGVWHLHGHCHNGLDDKYYVGSPKADVGIDAASRFYYGYPNDQRLDYRPFEFQDLKFLSDIKYIPIDHHDSDCH